VDGSLGAGTAQRAQAVVTRYYRRLLSGFEPILDVGCGRGEYLGAASFGVDLDISSLRGLARVAQVDLLQDLPFADAVFGGVLANDVIEHVENPRHVLRELNRIAKPDAKLVIVTPRAIPRAVWSDYTHLRGFTKNAILRLLDDTGWHAETIYRMGSMPLAGRLHAMSLLPMILRIPGVGHYFGTNWEVVAHKGG
jgi:SAM-dependent methyltransferase